MTNRFRSVFGNFLYILLWLIFVVLVTLTLFQLHGTIISIAVYVVNDPALRPIGWNTGSVILLTRLLWLVMGILWLGWVSYTYEYLNEGSRLQILIKRSFRLLLTLGAVYLSSYLILLFLA
jgi:hypothetical protein